MYRVLPDEAKSEELIEVEEDEIPSSPKERFFLGEASLGRRVVVHDGTFWR